MGWRAAWAALRAVDANVIVRLIVQDDAGQQARALALIEAERVLVPLTVAMECEWVLRSFYKLSRAEINIALDEMTAVANVVFEQVRGVRWALRRLAKGANFADMIHIVQAAAAGATAFVTFDEPIDGEAGAGAPLPVDLPA